MHRVAIGLCLATALGVSLAAQAGNPPAGQQPPSTTAQPATPPATPPAQPPSSAASSAGDMTLTGCLQKGAEGNFTLTNVQADARSGSSSGAAAPTGTAGATTPGAASSAAPAGATSTWSLKGGTDLANHVGHRIAVTGKAAAASAASGSTPGATTAPPATTTAGSSSSSMRTLEVASVKMIAATCP